ncbi:hypothetical protein ACF1AB_39770 [Streptomyces sp. NPDC014846]|uniref:hypothetical protein n=1 Tax=Streptomyces sp. NPDC014846 TaxID=3364922 RepID=UPI0036FFE2A1
MEIQKILQPLPDDLRNILQPLAQFYAGKVIELRPAPEGWQGPVHAWGTDTGPLVTHVDGEPVAVATWQELCPAGGRPAG